MATEHVELKPEGVEEDALRLGAPFEIEQESGSSTNLREVTTAFQPISMVFKWSSESVFEVRNETRQFKPSSMVFKRDAQGNIELPAGVSLPTWLSVKNPQQELKPPLVYIFNHEEFKNPAHAKRDGTEKDVEALSKTFGQLNCQVKVIPNPTKAKVEETIKILAAENFDYLSALVVIFLSHGYEEENICAYDDVYHLEEHVLQPLIRNRNLQGKPKILISQACRSTTRADAVDEEYGYYIKCYSTSLGQKSYRDIEKGSIYIQRFCEVMDKDALTKDFTEIIKDVNEKTKARCRELRLKQKPTTEGVLKPFCFGHFVKSGNEEN